jgi:UDP-N-acetylmuramoyl-L-alanyl-D-glutamate--2,6-diaminopimelate ligase
VRTRSTADLIAALERAGLLLEVLGDVPPEAADVCDDSRRVAPGDIFVAVHGSAVDGHGFVDEARALGASLAVVERQAEWPLPVLRVSDARRAAVLVADLVYDSPAEGLRIAGVTGTNGKTTTVHLARVVLDATVGAAASLGTLGVLEGREGRAAPGGAGLTTPGAIELRRVLRRLGDSGARCIAMEVSSHSLVQGRVDGIPFEAAAFTTFTRDHLDYHGSMEAYFDAKALFARHVVHDGTLVTNADDPAWARLPRTHRTITYGVNAGADVTAGSVCYTARGSEWMLEVGGKSERVTLPLVGEFNVGNALAAASIALVLGAEVGAIAAALSDAPQVPGRLEVLSDAPLVLRDYAHTPDALERSLQAARRLGSGTLTLVFGCGGDRDRGKRPLMGEVAARLADQVIVTSDNPRTEDPERIIDDVVRGLRPDSYERVEDRREAIRAAVGRAAAGDTVLIAGKGHETYQIRGTSVLPFDEKEIVAELLAVSS